MTLDPSDMIQLLMGALLGVIGLWLRQALNRLDRLEKGQGRNATRLIRIEARLGMPEFSDVAESGDS